MISWTENVINEVSQRFKEERYVLNIIQTVKRRKAKILRTDCLLTHVIERKIEGRREVTV